MDYHLDGYRVDVVNYYPAWNLEVWMAHVFCVISSDYMRSECLPLAGTVESLVQISLVSERKLSNLSI